MDIYFDFEATQFSERVIAIGATCEYGDFDCLVSSFKKKITPFITQLTGITKEMVEGAPTADEAFSDLYQWIAEVNPGEPLFYHCYGDTDRVFLRKTAEKIEDANIAKFIYKLADSMIDDSKVVCRYFHAKSIGVHRALTHFEPEIGAQDHDPLNDAILLRSLMEHIEIAEPLEVVPEEEEEKPVKKVPKNYIISVTHLTDLSARVRHFPNEAQAADWMYVKLKKKYKDTIRANVVKKVMKALEEDGNYNNWHFERIEKEDENNV